MKGIHVNWTKPFFDKNGIQSIYSMHDFDILTQISAAMYWKKYNGEIILYTDTAGLKYYKSIGLDTIYDKINTTILDEYNTTLANTHRSPCLGRMHVLTKLEPPFVAMDIDLVLMNKIPEPMYDTDIRFFHWEIPDNSTYPPLHKQYRPDDFVFDEDWDSNMMVPNIAILYVKNNEIWPEFPEKASEYIQKCLRDKCQIPHADLAIFADQRMLGMMAKKEKLAFDSFLDKLWLCSNERIHDKSMFSDGATPHWVSEQNINLGMFAYDQIPAYMQQMNMYKKDLIFYHSWIGKADFLKPEGSEERRKYSESLLKKTLKDIPESQVIFSNPAIQNVINISMSVATL